MSIIYINNLTKFTLIFFLDFFHAKKGDNCSIVFVCLFYRSVKGDCNRRTDSYLIVSGFELGVVSKNRIPDRLYQCACVLSLPEESFFRVF